MFHILTLYVSKGALLLGGAVDEVIAHALVQKEKGTMSGLPCNTARNLNSQTPEGSVSVANKWSR